MKITKDDLFHPFEHVLDGGRTATVGFLKSESLQDRPQLYVIIDGEVVDSFGPDGEPRERRNEVNRSPRHMDYMVGPEHIAKLKGLKKETGASHSHFVRKAILGLKGNSHDRRKAKRALER